MLSPNEIVNRAKSEIKECNSSQITEAIKTGQIIIDVREPSEFSQSKIENAVNIPRGLLEFSLLQTSSIKDKFCDDKATETPIFLYCQSGGRSALAAKSLQDMGFSQVFSLAGGIKAWLSHASASSE